MSPATSRRALIGTSFEAGTSKAAELDGDIIQASREYVALEAELGRLCSLEGNLPMSKRDELFADMDVVHDQQDALRAVMAATPARTPEGLRAKAAALQAWLPTNPDGTAPYRDEDALAWSLCDDLLGRA